MWVRECDGRREGTKNDVSKLDTAGWYHVAKSEVIFAEELGKIVEENQKESQSAAIQIPGSMLQVRLFQKWRQELEERQEELVESGPSLLCG